MTESRLTLLVIAALLLPTGTIAESADERTKVEMPAPMRAHTLANMRDHLAAIETISRQLATGDFEAAADTAESRLGVSAIPSHGGPQRAKYMPQGMRAIGMAMHRAASRFALAARDAEVSDDLGGAFSGLADVMQQCVACHKAYRLH
jgi:cytochrome c556